jgi:BirA family transcriptional regulator, biotin operon repressor / biotin---[acetyl-CoA-carboxylase] ligase
VVGMAEAGRLRRDHRSPCRSVSARRASPSHGWGWLPLLTGLAVVDAVREVAGVDAGLKWPNDVLVTPPTGAPGTKLAGILAEVAAPVGAIVVGLGLNVTLTAEEVPDPVATSLLMLGADATDRTALVRAILRSLAERVDRWRTAGGADAGLLADYRAASLTLGTEVRVTLPGDRQLEGTAESIDEMGRLRIATEAGTVTVSAGDITHLRPRNDPRPG